MKRRNFIKNSVLAAGALSLPLTGSELFAAHAASAPAAANNFKKAIMWSGIGVGNSVLDKCKAIKESGFQGVEVNSHMNRQEVLDATKSTGLGIVDVCCTTHGSKPMSHPDPTTRKEGFEGVVHTLEDAAAYGIDAILLVPGRVNETVSYDDCWKLSTEGVKKLVPIAKKLKVTIGIENVWNNFLLSPLEACRYVDQFKSPWVKFYFDCGNIVPYGWPEQWIKILGDRIIRIHIKEYGMTQIVQPGNNAQGVTVQQARSQGFRAPLTEGTVDWPKVMATLRQNYKHSWLTTEQPTSRTLDELKDLNSRLEKIINM
jgi:hexulose-6-phosphate isomerase